MSNELTIEQLVSGAGKSALLNELENYGCNPQGLRAKCPWAGCQDKGEARSRNAAVYDGGKGHFRVKCHSCGETGDLVDLMMRSRGLSRAEAIASMRGSMPSSPITRKHLALAPQPEDSGKLQPPEVKRIWEQMARVDAMGRTYLDSRRAGQAEDLGLVRYATDTISNKSAASCAKGGWRLGMLCSDVVGNPRGIQLRLCREAKPSEPKILSVTGSATSRAFMGAPWAIETADVVHVTEGIFDTLTVQLWAPLGSCVVGAPGAGVLPRLAEELSLAGVGIEGKVFCLWVQNDAPPSKSRQNFVLLAGKLAELGARVVYCSTPKTHSDVGDWIRAEPNTEWPPKELKEALGSDDDSSSVAVQDSGVLVAPARIEVDSFQQDFSTLLAVLDHPVHAPFVVGNGEFWTDEMTGYRMHGKSRLRFPEDALSIKYRLEGILTQNTARKLRYAKNEIEDACALLCSRRRRHPVREYLLGLPQWDGVDRVAELCKALRVSSGELQLAMMKRWLVSAVARVIRPGCKVDTALILTGGQGQSKSSFFDTMAGDGWYTSSMGDIRREKQALMVMGRYWIIEWGELDAMNRTTPEHVKDFLSRRTDSFIPPYGHEVVEVPRTSVIVGTSNQGEFLTDDTGSRRFWPLTVLGDIDLEWVSKHRDVLWSQAMALMAAREQHWLTNDEESLRSVSTQESHTITDPWMEAISEWLADTMPMECSVGQILEHAIKMPTDRWTRREDMKVGACMRALGWAKSRKTSGGVQRWVYVKNFPSV